MIRFLKSLARRLFRRHAPSSMPPLIHRDDVPFELAEEIEAKLKEQYPGYTIRYAGDRPEDLPAAARDYAEELARKFRYSIEHGTCLGCGKKYPGAWPEEGDLGFGWSLYGMGGSRDSDHLVCGECDNADGVREICGGPNS